MKQHRSRLVLLSASIATLGMMQSVSASELVDVSQEGYTESFHSAKASQSPAEAAKQYLIQRAAQLNLESDLGNFVVESVTESPVGYHVRFAQMRNNMPVDGASIVVTLNPENQVLTYVNDSVAVQNSKLESLSLFSLSEDQVAQIAYNELKLTASPTRLEIVKKVFVENGETRNAYQVNLAAPIDKVWSWELLIDATSGKIYRSETKAFDAHDSHAAGVSVTANVFESNPTIRSGKAYGGVSGYDVSSSNNAFFDSMMTGITLDNVTKSGSNYILSGPNVALADFESPTNPKCVATSPSMTYKRNNPCFTDVSVYYFVDKTLRYLNDTLGFKAHPMKGGALQVDPHGVNGDDNSHYDGASDRLAFGDGGVPDGQDHDVVIHELGHAIHNWLTKGHLSQSEGLSEGIGDYWASSYDRQFMKPGHVAYNWTFSYDGHNPFWPGRINNVSVKYPAAVQGANAEIHTAGQMWATVCMDVYDSIGKLKTDKIHWTAIAMLNGSSNLQDAAKAFVVATRQLYPSEPATLQAVLTKFKAHGFSVQ